MSAQVNNLLDMARIESGDVRLRREWNSIEEIVGSALRLTRPLLLPRHVLTDVPVNLPLVECDAVLIERVLVNLLENAAKYTPTNARILVAARVDGREMSVAVEDDGPGIRPGKESEIFEKFTRGQRESSISGVGLGLAICKAIVEAHGGSISVAPSRTSGAKFTFTLPIGEPPQLVAEHEDATAQGAQ
jgi:two-component system sensor histidine kinase KdpD